MVWRKPNTAYEKNLITTVKHGGGGVMVWRCMGASSIGEFVFIEGNMNKFQNLNILGKKSEKQKKSTNWIFQMISSFNKTTTPSTRQKLYVSCYFITLPTHWKLLHNLQIIIQYNICGMNWRPGSGNKQNRTEMSSTGGMEKKWYRNTKKLVYSMPHWLREIIYRKGMQTSY